MITVILSCIVILIVILFSFDIYFHFNIIINLLIGRLRRRKKITDTISIYRISGVHNTDLTCDHLNNVKYIMYMDFAKAYFWANTRLLDFLIGVKAFPLQSATVIRYMKSIPIFTRVRIDTKVNLKIINCELL